MSPCRTWVFEQFAYRNREEDHEKGRRHLIGNRRHNIGIFLRVIAWFHIAFISLFNNFNCRISSYITYEAFMTISLLFPQTVEADSWYSCKLKLFAGEHMILFGKFFRK